ncbi:hypothetical protein JTB14_016748 [Gonioctena quinquepunctata]|nr:hypothetical protein JTB14_016748 [Gonioctena quinquepunctata]
MNGLQFYSRKNQDLDFIHILIEPEYGYDLEMQNALDTSKKSTLIEVVLLKYGEESQLTKEQTSFFHKVFLELSNIWMIFFNRLCVLLQELLVETSI